MELNCVRIKIMPEKDWLESIITLLNKKMISCEFKHQKDGQSHCSPPWQARPSYGKFFLLSYNYLEQEKL